jgi:predicted GIY-YIG superfamily endonuclease
LDVILERGSAGVVAVVGPSTFNTTKKLRHPDRSEAQWRDPRIFARRCNTLAMVEQAYIMASSFQRLYIGITTEIEKRVAQHKNGSYSNSFSSRYKIDKLVYFERFAMPPSYRPRKTTQKLVPHQKTPPHHCSKSNMAGSNRRVGQINRAL